MFGIRDFLEDIFLTLRLIRGTFHRVLLKNGGNST